MKFSPANPLKTMAAAMVMLIIIAAIDFFIPVDVQVVLLYLLPIAYISLNAPMRHCAIVCIWAVACWGVSNYFTSNGSVFNGIRLWNMFSRGVIFFTFVSLIHYYKAQLVEKELAMAALRRSKLESNPIMGLRRICRECDKVKSATDEWVPIKTWLSRDCNVTWADSCCPSCSEAKLKP